MKDRGSSSRLIILCGLMTFCFLTVALLIGIERAVHMHFEEQLADLHSTVDEMRNEISLVVSKQVGVSIRLQWLVNLSNGQARCSW